MRRVHLVVPLAACALLALGGCTGRPAAQDDRDGSLARTSPLLAESVNDARRLVREETASREAAPAVLPVSAGDGSANAAKAAAVEQAELKAQGDKEKEAPASPPQLAEKTSLEAVLRLAAKGPMVQAARHRWLAATHKRPQMVALPDPRVEATYYVVRGMDRYMFGLSQEFPYPGKLIIAGRMADKEAEAARLRYDAALRDALSDAKEAYFELYYIDRAQQVTGEIKKLYDRYAALAAGGKSVAQPKLPETFRAESQRAQLGYDLVLLKEMRATEAERLRAMLGLTAREGLGATEDVAEPAELAETLERLQEVATAHNQELAAAGVEIARAQYDLKLAHRAAIPDLMLGANYTRMDEKQREMMGVNNPVGVTAGITIPLWFPKYQARIKEAGEMEQAARSEEDARRLKVRADLAKAYFGLSNSSRLVRLYRETLIPQARQALQSVEELYRKNDAGLAGVLETTATVHNFELARLRATADFYQNVARLERVLGTAFQIKPSAPVLEDDKPAKPQETQP